MAGGSIVLGMENFEARVLKGSGIVVVDFWAPWCAPCRMFAPVFERVAAANPDITFAKVNTEDEQELAGALQISSIPTVMVFRDGILLFAQPGMLPQPALEELLQKVRALDMAKVLLEMDAEEAQLAKDGKAAEDPHHHA